MRGRIMVNCDIGERGLDHPVDRDLMEWIDIANIACGGHAGDRESVCWFRDRARERGVQVSAHLSYPDRAGFGRRSMEIPVAQLLDSLEAQHALLPDTTMVKLHGALYNDSCAHPALARALAQWLRDRGCTRVLTLPGSALAKECTSLGIVVLAEAFAERRYQYDPETRALSLVSRARPWACIDEVVEAVAQAAGIIERGEIEAIVEDGGTTARPETHGGSVADEARTPFALRTVKLSAETICVHSDSPIALPLAKKLAELVRA